MIAATPCLQWGRVPSLADNLADAYIAINARVLLVTISFCQ
jgi:hypothetical protein